MTGTMRTAPFVHAPAPFATGFRRREELVRPVRHRGREPGFPGPPAQIRARTGRGNISNGPLFFIGIHYSDGLSLHRRRPDRRPYRTDVLPVTNPAPLVTIFGATGFVGRAVVRHFARAGWRVRAGTRSPQRAGFLRPIGDLGQIVPVAVDIRRPSTLLSAVQGTQSVVNLVGILAPAGRQTFTAVHVDGAANAAKAAAAAGAAGFVHVSALGADAGSRSAYARTKGLAENRALEILPATAILRPGIVFGPEDRFFNRFAATLRLAPVMPVPGRGRVRLQPVYVEDVAAAVFRAATTPAAAGQTYELGGPGTRSLMAILRWIREQINRRCLLLPVPLTLLWPPAWLMERLPNPPLTRDQLRLLTTDNVVSDTAHTLDTLGITATAYEGIVPAYLERFRLGGDSLRG